MAHKHSLHVDPFIVMLEEDIINEALSMIPTRIALTPLAVVKKIVIQARHIIFGISASLDTITIEVWKMNALCLLMITLAYARKTMHVTREKCSTNIATKGEE